MTCAGYNPVCVVLSLVETVARKLFAGVPAAKFAIDSLVPTTPAVGMNVSDVLPPPSTVPTTKAWLDHGGAASPALLAVPFAVLAVLWHEGGRFHPHLTVALFLVAYLGETPLLGVPACALHHPVTALDLVLPRLLAGERIGKLELALLGHGGLCRDCPQCSYPHCPFGKGT